MSLRAFHLFFIALSIVLAAFCAAWAVGQYRAMHECGVHRHGGRGALVGALRSGRVRHGVSAKDEEL